jgi:hypothetical protein
MTTVKEMIFVVVIVEGTGFLNIVLMGFDIKNIRSSDHNNQRSFKYLMPLL